MSSRIERSSDNRMSEPLPVTGPLAKPSPLDAIVIGVTISEPFRQRALELAGVAVRIVEYRVEYWSCGVSSLRTNPILDESRQ